ncbi:uncharacterized protein LOC110837918 isoform X2 [Zootermopsis nevadensis]|nr:uncharacterized protein LOC110837918 isoform X2 [Zootermopsis nevadensis]XP_021936272.1 uncharacterized protein LOC110837918 isoform X2 [Zootermopsis nevadensis]
MDALQGQLNTLREIMESFPVGAATSVDYSLENEIRRSVNTISLANAKLLMLKAQDRKRKLPQDRESLDLYQLPEVLGEYDEEITKASVRKLAWRHSAEASHVRRLMSDAVSAEPGIFTESFQSTVDLLNAVIGLNSQLRGVLKEQRDTALQIITKKQELQHKLDDYKELLVAQEVERHERATAKERENMEQKKRLQLRLEKLNVMRMLMTNLLSISNTDYIKHQEWTNILIEKQGFISVETLMASNTAVQ